MPASRALPLPALAFDDQRPVVFVSAYDESCSPDSEPVACPNGRLNKPFTLGELQAVVGQVLAACAKVGENGVSAGVAAHIHVARQSNECCTIDSRGTDQGSHTVGAGDR